MRSMTRPKGERRSTLASEFDAMMVDFLQAIERFGDRLAVAARHNDPFVDQMLTIADVAWLMRSSGGDISVIISTGLAAGRVAADAPQKVATLVGRTEAGRDLLEKARVAAIAAAGARRRHQTDGGRGVRPGDGQAGARRSSPPWSAGRWRG